MKRLRFLSALLFLLVVATTHAVGPVSELEATARDGQVFPTWKEAETPEGATFNVNGGVNGGQVSTLDISFITSAIAFYISFSPTTRSAILRAATCTAA